MTRILSPVDVATRTRFRAVRRDLDAHDGRAWQLRVELDHDDSSLVEIAEELLTSDKLSAQPVTGKGSVLRVTVEQAGWLRHKLDVLFARLGVDAGAYPAVEEQKSALTLDPSWVTSAQAAMRLGLGYRAFLRRVRALDAVPVHEVGKIAYWNEDQVRTIGGNSSSVASVRKK